MTRPVLASWIRAGIREAGWAPLTVFVAHAIFVFTGGYRSAPHFDNVLHLCGGMAMAHFFAVCLQCAQRSGWAGQPSMSLLDLCTLALTGTATVLWEFAEWIQNFVVAGHIQLTINDTLKDMAVGLAGGAFIIGWKRWKRTRHDTETNDEIAR